MQIDADMLQVGPSGAGREPGSLPAVAAVIDHQGTS
jgi:hypothetical protein